MLKSLVYLFPICWVLNLSSLAQDVNYSDFFGSYTGANAIGYNQPLADLLGATMNSGTFHRVKAKKLGFELYIDLIGTMAFVPEDSKTFTAIPEGDVEPKTPTTVPTIVGDATPVEYIGDNGMGYVFPGGYSLSYIPLVYPQITIGSVFGTQFTFRYFYTDIEDYGKLNFANYGINHDFGQWFNDLPVDLSLSFNYHSYGVIDSLSGDGYTISLKSNYDWKILSFYGALSYENSNTQIKYISEPGNPQSVSLDLNGTNVVRFTIGTMVNFGPLKLFVDYSLAKQSVLAFGLGFGINEQQKKIPADE